MTLHEEIMDAIAEVAPVTLPPDDLCQLASYLEHYQLVTLSTARERLRDTLVGKNTKISQEIISHRIPYHIYRSTMHALGQKPLGYTRWNRCTGMIHDRIQTRQAASTRWERLIDQGMHIGRFVSRNMAGEKIVWMVEDITPDCRLVLTSTGNRIYSTTNGVSPMLGNAVNTLEVHHEVPRILAITG